MIKAKFRKRSIVHKWSYFERPMRIERLVNTPNTIAFSGSVFLPLDKDEYSVAKVSKIQKILKQSLWQYLTDNKLNNENYVLMIDAPSKPKGTKVFIRLVMCFQVNDNSNMEIYEPLFEDYMKMLIKGF